MRQKGFIDPQGFLIFLSLIFLSGVAVAIGLPYVWRYAIKPIFAFLGAL